MSTPSSPPRGPNEDDPNQSTEPMKIPANRSQVKRLAKLAKNFDKAVEELPDKGVEFKREHTEVADARRKAQMKEGLLRMRVR